MGVNRYKQPVSSKPHIVHTMMGWVCSDPDSGIFHACEGRGKTPAAAFERWDAARSVRDYALAA